MAPAFKMKHARGLVSTLQAFRSIFLTPLETLRPQSLRYRPIQSQRQSRFIQNSCPRPFAHSRALFAETKPKALQDEDIRSEIVQIAADDGKLGAPQRLKDVLGSIDRSQYFVLQVSPGASRQPPVCKIFSKRAVREYIRSKEKAAHATKTAAKQIELNWAIDSHDLAHRLKQLSDFLEKGRKVEIILTRKKGKRAPTPDEIKHVMTSVTETTQKANAILVKPVEGEPGHRVQMVVKKKDD